ncbi:MBL fold hydrolase [Maritimibacter sp. 55A14]|uniref:ribonuclease J n=1 Tax=Maritimibacter sp. 55A14 TaxID=2174844 RepID=UPI000D6098A0|nr:ribonuclease J [Maritimibacter sp. 55A14]PWE33929.1 MBL fold hydrolase [Maritimibacter sp. 55A14]
MSRSKLIYLPLGGAGEIGMNMYVYGYGAKGKERFILVDCGVAFPDMDSTPGVDLIMADIAWLLARRDRLEAIFITHAHEDHVGALSLLWDRLRAPVYARPFTAAIARLKMKERGHPEEKVKIVQPWPAETEAGPFRVRYLPVSHSIPESSALVIDTPAGRLIHTGDFKLDETPGVGEPWDPEIWREAAAGGVKALICDSTNVFSPHPGRSEATLTDNLAALVAGARGMVVATTFASNVARVKTLAEAGRDAGRSVVLLGRAMQRMVRVAEETGVLTGFPATTPVEDALQVPRENLMLLVTGSQGERRAASAQLSRGKYLGLTLKEGDLFIFSSKTIPGNERSVIQIMNAFSEMGVDVVEGDERYHVSGHANRPDLEAVHDLVKPQMVIPMHGEHRHLREHANLAISKGMAAAVAPNGTMLDISGDAPEVLDHIEAGRTYLDGTVLIGAMDGVVRDRIRMALNGHVTVGVIVDESDEALEDAWVEVKGLPEKGASGAPLVDLIEDEVAEALGQADERTVLDDDKLETLVRRRTRQAAVDLVGRKPEVTVLISRLMAE